MILELVTMTGIVIGTIIIFITLLYVIAVFIAPNTSKSPKAEIVFTVIIFFFALLWHLLNSYTTLNTVWVLFLFVITLGIFLCYFRKEVLKTFKETIGTLNYLKEITKYKLGN